MAAEINPHPRRVHDLLFPSPIPLTDTIALSIALNLWRDQINQCRINGTLSTLDFGRPISIESHFSTVPESFQKIVLKHTGKHMWTVGLTIEQWLSYHYDLIFKYHHDDYNHVLRDFDDFVLDFDGSINYSETAKRVLLCDRFNDVEKFLVACQYCFGQDVVKYWSAVSSAVNIDAFDMPLVFYWVNQIGFGIDHQEALASKIMLQLVRVERPVCSVIDYFWGKIDSASRVEVAISKFDTFICVDEVFRFILPKFTEKEFDSFVQARGDQLVPLLLKFQFWMPLVIPVWQQVKHKISDDGFLLIVRTIFDKQTNFGPELGYGRDKLPENQIFSENNGPYPPNTSKVCCEIWKTASDHQKQLAIREVLSDSSLFIRKDNRYSSCRQVEFLLAVLADLSMEERRAFGMKNWQNLIYDIRTEDLSELLNLCIGDQKQIDQFKRSHLSNYDLIAPCYSQFLNKTGFFRLNDFLNFCCPDERTKKSIKSRLLREHFKLDHLHIVDVEKMDEFIRSAFDDEEQITKFKAKLTRKMAKNRDLMCLTAMGSYSVVMKFVDTMVVKEEVATDLKQRHFPQIVRDLLGFLGHDRAIISEFRGEELTKFMRWCLGDDDEKIEEFKKSIKIDETFRQIAEGLALQKDRDPYTRRPRQRGVKNFRIGIDELLNWYFPSPEAVADFKTRLADVFEKIARC